MDKHKKVARRRQQRHEARLKSKTIPARIEAIGRREDARGRLVVK